MNHSPEPWKIISANDSDCEVYQTIVDAKGQRVIDGYPAGGDCADCMGYPDVNEGDLERIVACVNAMAGVPDPSSKGSSGEAKREDSVV